MRNSNKPYRSVSKPCPLGAAWWAAFVSLLLVLPGSGMAGTIGVKFLTGANVGNTNASILLPTDTAGAGIYAQANWNNVAGALGTNVAVLDSAGAATPIAVSWSSPNTWSQSGNTTTSQGAPDANLMNSYLDNNGNANVAITSPYNMFSTTAPANNNRNWPMIYLTGLQAWLAAQGAAAYDVVIYSDGDATSGRTGEFWLVNASGTPDALTVGADVSTHVFICDLNNYIVNPTYSEVPFVIQSGFYSGGLLAEYGNFPGNYTALQSLTNDTVLIRSQRFNSRAPINAIQIVPRATVVPATFAALYNAPVYAGGKARFAPLVAGATPMTFQWLKNNAPLTDGGNIAGATTRALTVSGVGAGDVASYSLVVSNPVGVVTSGPAALTIVAPAANSYPEKILTKNPFAYWRFNETQDPATGWTPAFDAVGGCTATYGIGAMNGYTLIPGPSHAEWPGFETGNLGYQSSRSGPRQTYLMAPPLLLQTNTVTMCAWIYPTVAQPGFTALISTRSTDTAAFGYGNNNNLGYTWNSNSAATYNFVSGLVPRTNEWNFVALAVSPTNAILYCYNTNGQLSATNTLTHSNQFWGGATYIGGDIQGSTIVSPTNRSFIGTIDEFTVFNQTLSPSEIYDLYKKGLGLNAIGPSIPNQPQSLALFEGRTAKFSVTASGDTPISYRWRRNGANLSDGGNISGATTPSLTISNVTIAVDSATYDVVVGNLVGSIPSTPVSLTVVASNSVPAAYEAKLRAYNPIAYWRLDEAVGSQYSYDYWGGNIATNENVTLGVAGPQPPDFVGLETTNSAGQYSSAATADTASFASLMNNRAAFSIIGWFNCPSLPIGNRVGLFGQNDVCEFGFHGNGADGLAQIGIWTPRGAAFLNQSNIVANAWYMVAAVGDGTNVSLTLVSTNGGGGFQVLQAVGTPTVTTNYGSSPFPFRIGGGGILDTTGNYFDGLIDEVAVFDRALSVGELSDLFGAALTGAELPPGISKNQVSQTLYAGRTATLSVSAVGTSPSYQWLRNGLAITDGGNVVGSTTPTLTITGVTAANVGDYEVVITNRVGSVTSAPPAHLAVITPIAGSFEAAMIGLNPLAYYRFTETNDPALSGVVAYDYWGGHNGVYGVGSANLYSGIMGPQAPIFSKFETGNGALGTTAGVTASYATAPFGTLSTNTVSMTMWINPTGTLDDYAGLLVNRNSGVAGGFGYTGGQLGYTWNNNSGNTYNFRSGLVPPMNQWSFVALVITPTNATVYMINTNGAYSAVNELAHTADVFGNNWQIGHDDQDSNANRTFNGVIDEVGVFTYSLSAAQIQHLAYSSGLAQPIQLSVQPTGTNTILLNWTGNASSYVIQTKTSLNDATWTDSQTNSGPPAVVPIVGGSSFFRVRSN